MHFWDMATHHIWHVFQVFVPNVQGVQTWIGFREESSEPWLHGGDMLGCIHLSRFRSELRKLRYKSATKTMVEGDGCHRIAAEHRKSLVGRKLKAKSPNGRFKAGAQAIMKCGGVLTKIEVHGKNMFYFFGQGSKMVVVHVHFGLAGAQLWELKVFYNPVFQYVKYGGVLK